MKITAEMLRESSLACKDQIRIFEHEWPDGCLITCETLSRAIDLGLDISWVGQCLLPPPYANTYAREHQLITLRHWPEILVSPAWRNYCTDLAKVLLKLVEEYENTLHPGTVERINHG